MSVLTRAHYEEGMKHFREQLASLGQALGRKVAARINNEYHHEGYSAPVTFNNVSRHYSELSQAEAVELIEWAVEYDQDADAYAAQGVNFERFARLKWNDQHGVSMGGAQRFNAPFLAAVQRKDREFVAKRASRLS